MRIAHHRRRPGQWNYSDYSPPLIPYVRRIRLLLGERDYVFRDLAIYAADEARLARHNPVRKVPVLLDGEHTLFDSRVIARYLNAQLGWAPLDWAQENRMTVVDGANDALVGLRLAARSGLAVDGPVMIYERHSARIADCFAWREAAAARGDFDAWDFPAICLYCLVDWADYRGLLDWAPYPALLAVREHHRQAPAVAATDPRAAA